MNDARRKKIDEAYDLIVTAEGILNTCGDEEGEYYENMPEGIADSEKGIRADEVTANLNELANELDELLSRIEETKESA
jgi:hypothetical protein